MTGGTGSPGGVEGSVRQEVVIDIHVSNMKLRIKEIMDGTIPTSSKGIPVRIVWSRGKKEAKTKYRYLNSSVDERQFDEKIQINTVLNLDPETMMPREQKMSRLAVTLNRDYNYMELAEVSFDMANFKYGKYDGMRLFLNQVASNSQYTIEQDSYIEIGIKGT